MNLPKNYNKLKPNERKYVREEYVKRQKGLCQYCNKSLDKKAKDPRTVNKKLFPEGFFNHPVHLHHDHETGMTIGAVHNLCNALSWEYENV